MNKNNFIRLLCALLILTGVPFVSAQTPNAAGGANTGKAAANAANKKKIKIDYENELVMGNYDVPDAQFLNSRRMIKYKELFNKRTNFIDEIESNKGLFNEYQK